MSSDEEARAARRRLGEELRGYRKSRQWTLRELSEKANLSLGYLSDIERGTKEPTLTTLLVLARALDLRFVMSFREEPK